MENTPLDNLSALSARIEEIMLRLNALENAMKKLGVELPAEDVPTSFADEAIDLSFDEENVGAQPVEPTIDDIPSEEDAEAISIGDLPDDMPYVEKTEETISVVDLPDDMPEEDPEAEAVTVAEADVVTEAGMQGEAETVSETEAISEDVAETIAEDENPIDNLFGEEYSLNASAKEKPRRGRKASSATLGESVKGKVAVLDALAEKLAWMKDMPGTEVRSLRSAIALGDQVLFIRRLFRDDSALYQDTIDRLNSMPDLEKAVAYLHDTFPEWNMESEDVYRFMMAVRRKIRK